METKEIALAAILAALYAALVIVLIPISFGPLQLRIADCLIPLAALLGWPAILGVSMGAFLGNAYYMSFTGPIDVIFGTIANLIASALIFKYRNKLLLACIAGAVTVGVVVGGYLWIYFPPPNIMGITLPWMAMMISITLSSLVSIAIIGYLIVKNLNTLGFKGIIESRGISTYI
jgi:uncharacterized membrane protein